MRLLVITHSLDRNGAAVCLVDLLLHLRQQGWSIDVLHGGEGPFVPELHAVGIRTLNRLNRHQYDVALINTVLDARWISSLEPHLPCLLWAHEGRVVLPPGTPSVAAWRTMLTQASKLVFQTAWQAHEVLGDHLDTLRPNQLALVPNGLPEWALAPLDTTRTSQPTIAWTGVICPRKRPGDMAKAVLQLTDIGAVCQFTGNASFMRLLPASDRDLFATSRPLAATRRNQSPRQRRARGSSPRVLPAICCLWRQRRRHCSPHCPVIWQHERVALTRWRRSGPCPPPADGAHRHCAGRTFGRCSTTDGVAPYTGCAAPAHAENQPSPHSGQTHRSSSWTQNVSTSLATPSTTWPCERKSYGGIFDFDAKFERLRTVNASLEDPSVWNDPKKAQELGKEKKSLDGVVLTLDKLTRELADNTELYDMSKEEGDEAGLMTIEAETAKLKPEIEQLEFRRMFRNEADPLNCFVDIQAGAGGTEACDWASMLLRQYLKYAERKGFKTTVEEETPGDVAGIKSATIKIEGEYAYGLLRTETGVHRLVRKSPFDSSGGRHTSFASLFVYPEIDDSIQIDINPADVRTDTYRASGAGGQHINKTDSAVRLTHMPTGIVVQCQDGRSQHGNRDIAWQRLRSKLYDFEMRKRQEEAQKLEDTKTDVGWGHQIRSYVLDNSRIKDLRTNVEISATQKVLDGDLDAFIEASLKQGV
jgi:peptide chain release factor 2